MVDFGTLSDDAIVNKKDLSVILDITIYGIEYRIKAGLLPVGFIMAGKRCWSVGTLRKFFSRTERVQSLSR